MGSYKVAALPPTPRREGKENCPFFSPPASSLPLLHPDTGMTPSALDEWILGRPSTSKRLFHPTNVNIKLLICPGAIKLSSAKGEKIPAVLYICSCLLQPYQHAQPACRARESRNGCGKRGLRSRSGPGIAGPSPPLGDSVAPVSPWQSHCSSEQSGWALRSIPSGWSGFPCSR